MKEPEMERDIVTIKIYPEELETVKKNCRITIGTSSIMGTRKNQEDSIFGYEEDSRALAIVCDGMGGLKCGELASKSAVESLAEAYFAKKDEVEIPEFFEKEAIKADEKVYLLEDEEGNRLRAGTTLTAIVMEEDKLYWLSVGDSKIYIIRGNEILAVNREHNYRMTLDAMLEKGEITPEEYQKEEYKAEALISYIGMGNVSLMDINRQPFYLKDGDMVLLSSDGLYRSLTEDEILEIVRAYAGDVQNMAQALTSAALGEKKSGQDNTSVVILEYHNEAAEEVINNTITTQ